MPCFQGTLYVRTFQLRSCSTNLPIDISNWTFRSMIRNEREDEIPLVELSTLQGGVTVLDGPNGRMQFKLVDDETLILPLGRVKFDVERTDFDPIQGPIWLFEASFLVKRPITRDTP